MTPDIPERPALLWRQMGRALFTVQMLEFTLSHFTALVLHKSREEAFRLLESSLRKTLGQLVKDLSKEDAIPEGFDKRLDAFVEERNWLVHRLYRLNCYDIHSDKAFTALIERLEAITGEASALSKFFVLLSEQWCHRHGISQAQLDHAASKIMQDSLREN